MDGYAAPSAPYRDLGEPSWFGTEGERRRYWYEHATEVVHWAREHGFAHPRAAIRYGLSGPRPDRDVGVGQRIAGGNHGSGLG